jgi:hypothetical protein
MMSHIYEKAAAKINYLLPAACGQLATFTTFYISLWSFFYLCRIIFL